MSTIVRTISSAAMTALAVVLAVLAAARVSIVYALPPRVPGGAAISRTDVDGAALGTAVACGIAGVLLLAFALWNLVARPRRGAWLCAAVVLVVAVAWYAVEASGPARVY